MQKIFWKKVNIDNVLVFKAYNKDKFLGCYWKEPDNTYTSERYAFDEESKERYISTSFYDEKSAKAHILDPAVKATKNNIVIPDDYVGLTDEELKEKKSDKKAAKKIKKIKKVHLDKKKRQAKGFYEEYIYNYVKENEGTTIEDIFNSSRTDNRFKNKNHITIRVFLKFLNKMIKNDKVIMKKNNYFIS